MKKYQVICRMEIYAAERMTEDVIPSLLDRTVTFRQKDKPES
jgi:hypothetical protein